MKIICIHGRSQENKAPAALEKLWTEALHAGLNKVTDHVPSGLSIALPYYGDLLFRLSENAARQESGVVTERGAGAPSAEELEFSHDILREIARSKGLGEPEIAGQGEENLAERGIMNWRSVLALLRMINGIEGATAAFLDLWVKDVWRYLTNKGVRHQVHGIIRPHIPDSEPCIVVAHSLGSIVGYNLLMERQTRSNIKCFITLGSPLGIPSIYERLPSDAPPRKAPHDVQTWLNARDARDAVALYEVSGKQFEGEPAVRNYNGVLNLSDNRHGIAQYLADAVVARAIHDALRAG